MPVTEALLEELTPIDFRVLPDENVLVFIYPQAGNDERLLRLLHENEFNIRVLIENETERHVIEIEFIETHIVMRMVFNKTETDYPLRRYANEGVIQNISCGIVDPNDLQRVLFQARVKRIDLAMGGVNNN